MRTPEEIRAILLTMGEEKYRAFTAPLIPTLDPARIIGIRTPVLRKFSRTLTGEEADAFLADLPHRYLEEDNLHGMIISAVPDAAEAIRYLDRFLPYVDNWATCDLIRPRCVRGMPTEVIAAIRRWMDSPHPYTVRFGMEMLTVYGLGNAYDSRWPQWVAGVRSEDYYVRMMQAWYFAEALAVRYEEILPYLTERRLEKWTHKKTVSKACDSFRISAEQKAYLRTLRL